MSQSIKVLVRIRPLSTSQKLRGCRSITQIDEQGSQINLTKPDQSDNIKSFAFDAVFPEQSEQALVYSKAAYELVDHVFQGYNGTIFAYGQTGCGKTHSMVGQPDNEDLQGIIPRCFGHVLKSISDTTHKQFLLRCSFLEIYNQEIHDLLGDAKAKLQLKESPEKGVFVKDLIFKEALTHQQLMEYLHQGNKNRAVGETAMNKDSSRSHLLFTLYLQSASGEETARKYVASRLNLVDLAGSQRLSKTGATGERLKQAQKINLSLSALGNVISALVEGRSQHIPYRDSKLTRMLQDSLGGNTKTVMLANCSPADYNFEETLSTLRYASRAKMIKNKPIINEDPKDALLRQYATEIQKLRSQLQGNTGFNNESPDLHSKLKLKQMELQNEKIEKANLMQRIKELQSHHIEGKNVIVDNKIIENVKKLSILMSRPIQKKQNCSINFIQNEHEEQKSRCYETAKTKKIQNKQINQLSIKLTRLQKQIRDIDHENYMEKECLLQDIRQLTTQNKFLENVIDNILQKHQLEQIRGASQYNKEKDQFRVPAFYIKNKQLIFPKLQQQQSVDMIKQMQQGRLIHIQSDKENTQVFNNPHTQCLIKREHNKNRAKNLSDFSLSDILKQARGVQVIGDKNSLQQKRLNRKIMLNPILKI